MENRDPESEILAGACEPSKGFAEACLEMCDSMNSVQEIDKLISYFVVNLAKIFKVNKISFMLLEESSGELAIKAFQGLSPDVAQMRVKMGELFSGWVAKEGKPLLVKDIEAEFPDLPKGRLSRYSTRSFVIVPVKSRDSLLGVVSLTDKKDGGAFTEQDLMTLNLISHYFALFIENSRLLEKNKDLATLDPLTGLYNHRYFHEQLSEEVYRCERYRRSLSLIMLNIDKFSDYNQAHGYAAGDSVLRQMAKLIKDNVRQTDLVARYGLDEFSVILPETKLKEACVVAEKIREKIGLAVFTENEARRSSLGMSRLTVSIGIAEHKIGWTEEELVRNAAVALQEAHQKGRNRVSLFK